MNGRVTRAVAGAALTAALVPGVALAAGPAAAAETRTFVGYGAIPSDAHADAEAQMRAYSSSCVEVSTTSSPAGSAHTWKATLTASC
ncbi:hypothetical protein ACFY2R_05490 [Micromonospora olivasterospora]|uniref:Uncharacterized protein n=1 Tax=Micromonospora olivasterospora TaxID=1880 RepID=A0A562IHZ9_MICOL|nr:hypothetical protein [Micromonospora olivasterospora]TWH70448.1 hypothetical protein JD77_05473 [Micromonospora olivasterospora]